MRLFDFFSSKDRIIKSDRFLSELQAYPPFERPFPGRVYVLTPEQAAANLAHLIACQDQRVSIVLGFLAKFGIHFAALDAKCLLKNAAALQDMLVENLPKIQRIHKSRFKLTMDFYDSVPGYKDEYIVCSFLQDLQIITFFALKSHFGPSIRWGLMGHDEVEDATSDEPKASEMSDYNAIVVMGLKDREYGHSSPLSLENIYNSYARSLIVNDLIDGLPPRLSHPLVMDLDQILDGYTTVEGRV
jgi:hypothetical protein